MSLLDQRGNLLDRPGGVQGDDLNKKTVNVPTARRYDGTRYRSHYADGTFETWGETVSISASGVVTGGEYEIERLRNGKTKVAGWIAFNPGSGTTGMSGGITLSFTFAKVVTTTTGNAGIRTDGNAITRLDDGTNYGPTTSDSSTLTRCRMTSANTVSIAAERLSGTWGTNSRVVVTFMLEGYE